jgi:hypothetical protein
MYLYQAIDKRLVHISQLQKSNTLYLENTCYNFLSKCFLIQVENHNSMETFAY